MGENYWVKIKTGLIPTGTVPLMLCNAPVRSWYVLNVGDTLY